MVVKKLGFLLSMLIVLSLLAAGCGSGNSSQNASATNSSDSTAKKHLKLWFYWEGKDRFDEVKKLTDGFTAKNPNIEVDPVYVPFADFKKRLSIGLASSDLPDIVIIDNPDQAAYAKLGLFADITDKLADWKDKDEYFPGPWKSVTYNNKIYGIPLGSNDLALFYNEAMLQKAGVKPPQTWDELRAAAKKLTGNGVTGFGQSATASEEGTFQFLPWLLSAGGNYNTIGNGSGAKALGLLTDLIQDGSMSKDVINWTQSDVEKQFAAGNIAMMLNGPWQLPTLASDAPNLKYGIALIPKDKKYASVLGGENLGVVNGPNVDEAVQFIKYVASPDVNKQFLIKFGYFPARKDLAQDAYWQDNPKLKVFAESLQTAEPRGPSPQWPEISQVIYNAMQLSLTGESTPQAAATDAQTKINAIINQK